MAVQDYKIVDCSTNTTTEEVAFLYRWNIPKTIFTDDLLLCWGSSYNESIESPVFTAGKNTQYSWHLRLSTYHPEIIEDDDSSDSLPGAETVYDVGLDLCLHKVDGNRYGDMVKASVQFSILGHDDQPLLQLGKKENVKKLQTDYMSAISENLGSWDNILFFWNGNGLIFNEHLNVECLIWIHEDKDINLSPRTRALSFRDKSLRTLRDFKKLVDFPTHSDFVIATPTNEFKAHKSFLSARSSVFAAMFESAALHERMYITDFSDHAIKEMLYFIYSGEVENMEGSEIDILQIAEKYNIQDLKLECTAAILSSLTSANAISNLVDVHIGNFAELKKDIIDFIARNKDAVKITTGFRNLNAILPGLFTELVLAIL